MYAEAEQRKELKALKRVLGPENCDTLTFAGNLASSLHRQAKYAEAEQMQREVHQAQKRVLGAEHRDTLRTAGHLANLLSEHMKHAEGLGGTAETAAVAHLPCAPRQWYAPRLDTLIMLSFTITGARSAARGRWALERPTYEVLHEWGPALHTGYLQAANVSDGSPEAC